MDSVQFTCMVIRDFDKKCVTIILKR